VELTTRNGQILKGMLRGVSENRLWVYDDRMAIPMGRTEIRSVRSRSRWMGALIGLAIGAGGGAIYGAKSAHRPLEGADLFGLLGAAVGACIGVNRTIYDGGPATTRR
jgi:hypothetical protein